MSHNKPDIRLLVTDLDNTLYDWVTYFVRSFDAMVETAHQILSVPKARLLNELRQVHQARGDSEYPFALLETQTVIEQYPEDTRLERKEHLSAALNRFNEVRNQTLRLYPGVEDVLLQLHRLGCPLVAHTEASQLNAVFRLRKLRVLRFFKRVYALEHRGELHPEPNRKAPRTRGLHLIPRDMRKPNPEILKGICRREGVPCDRAVYVGDSIMSDVAMAKRAGVWAVWAEYGTQYDPCLWEKLLRVTHWTKEDVSKATSGKWPSNIVPDVKLSGSFAELLDHFAFVGG